MEFVELFNLPLDANIIDIGGGDSYFAGALLDKGYQNIYVLDISVNAIERAKQRLGARSAKVHWKLKKSTIYSHVSKGKIPSIKKNGKLYFSKHVLENWLKSVDDVIPKPLFPYYKKLKKAI